MVDLMEEARLGRDVGLKYGRCGVGGWLREGVSALVRSLVDVVQVL